MVGQGAASFQGVDDVGDGQHAVGAAFQFRYVGFELLNGDVGGRVAGLPEPVVHEDHRPGVGGSPGQAAPSEDEAGDKVGDGIMVAVHGIGG